MLWRSRSGYPYCLGKEDFKRAAEKGRRQSILSPRKAMTAQWAPELGKSSTRLSSSLIERRCRIASYMNKSYQIGHRESMHLHELHALLKRHIAPEFNVRIPPIYSNSLTGMLNRLLNDLLAGWRHVAGQLEISRDPSQYSVCSISHPPSLTHACLRPSRSSDYLGEAAVLCSHHVSCHHGGLAGESLTG